MAESGVDEADRRPAGSPSPQSRLPAADVPAAVAQASIPTLLATLIQLTGDTAWLAPQYRPTPTRGLGENDSGGLPEHLQGEIRAAAANAVIAWLDGAPVAFEHPTDELLLTIFNFSIGEDVPDGYADFLRADLGYAAARGPDATGNPLAGLKVVVIGAGVSGIAVAVRLKRLGADVSVFEKTAAVGGTWNINRYPGCGVDTPSHLYSYSFTRHDWPSYYATQSDVQAYLEQVAQEFGVMQRIAFSTEVVSATFQPETASWQVEVRDVDQRAASITCHVLISAVGAFGRPSRPDIPGLTDFAGSSHHTAEWDRDAALEGKRVGVIGNGASAMQFVPAVAGVAEQLTVFQRSPQWVAPFEQFQTPVPSGVRDLLASVPQYRAWYRARLGWIFNDRIHASLQFDPEWPHQERSINAANDGHRRFFTRYVQSELDGHEDLLKKVLPEYPPFGKRMLLDNGWFRTLRRPDVALVTEAITSVDATGVNTADGTHHELDVLVLATGFDVAHYLAPMAIRGEEGQLLSDVWDGDDARAYLGMTVPGFPNLFCFYGPNAAPGHGGSFINTAECQLDYLIDLLLKMRSVGADSASCRQDVYDDYNVRVDAANTGMIWSHPGVSTYYRNSRGRVVYTNPWRIVDFWNMTRSADLDDYVLGTGPARS